MKNSKRRKTKGILSKWKVKREVLGQMLNKGQSNEEEVKTIRFTGRLVVTLKNSLSCNYVCYHALKSVGEL